MKQFNDADWVRVKANPSTGFNFLAQEQEQITDSPMYREAEVLLFVIQFQETESFTGIGQKSERRIPQKWLMIDEEEADLNSVDHNMIFISSESVKPGSGVINIIESLESENKLLIPKKFIVNILTYLHQQFPDRITYDVLQEIHGFYRPLIIKNGQIAFRKMIFE